MTATFTTRPVARQKHHCDRRTSTYCVDLIAPGEEYRRATTAPWAFDELERIDVDEHGDPIVAVARLERHPDGGRRGWRHELVCSACLSASETAA